MAFYVVCYILRPKEGNALQITCSLDYNHVKSSLPSIIETFPFIKLVPSPFCRDSWFKRPAICLRKFGNLQFCYLWRGIWLSTVLCFSTKCSFLSRKEVGWKNGVLVLPFLCFDLPAQTILSPCFLKLVSVGKDAWTILYHVLFEFGLVSWSVFVNVAPLHDKHKCNCGRFWKGQNNKKGFLLEPEIHWPSS